MSVRAVLAPAVILLAGGGPARSEEDFKLLADIDAAIDAGVEFILNSTQGPSGWMPDDGNGNKFATGYAAIQVYALVKSDVSYLHPTVQKGIAAMESFPFTRVYSVALYLMAYDAMIEQIDAEARLGEARPGGDRARFLEKMKAALEWLLAARIKGRGVWYYFPPPAKPDPRGPRYDHSNTQFAVLALGIAAERKLKIPPEVWDEIASHFIAEQEKEGPEVTGGLMFKTPEPEGEKDVVKRIADKKNDAISQRTVARKAHQPIFEEGKAHARGWKYTPDEYEDKSLTLLRRRLSMVCAGVSSLLIAQRNLAGGGARAQALKDSLRDGYGWLINYLGGNMRPGQEYYSFYSIEKVGDLGGVEAFLDFHWYQEIARTIVRLQRQDGAFREEYKRDEATIRSDTALALLFLNRATDLAARSKSLARPTRAGGAGRPGEAGEGGEAWIYLPSLKGEVPLARLFRLLRYRPGKQVMKLAEEAVKVIDPDRIDDAVRPLIGVWQHSAYAPARELARKLLASATGVDSTEEKAYLEWAERWGQVLKIGKEADSSEAEKLLAWLGTEQGTPLKVKVIWALQRTATKAAVGPLIDCLEDRDPALREAAYSAVTFLSGQSLPFHARGPEKDRAEEVRAWRTWQAVQGAKK
jgi:hypothetical protein